MKHIINVVLNHFTNDSRVLKTANSLIQFGYKVTVVAIHKKGLVEKDTIGDLNVHRVKLVCPFSYRYRLIQLFKHVEFTCRVLWRYRKVDIIHCNDLNTLPVGLLIKFFGKGVTVIYDCHEYETETNGLRGFEKKAKKLIESLLIRFTDQVITVSNSIANEYMRLYNISKPHLVLNSPKYIEQPKQNLFRKKLGIRDDQSIFLYQGGLNMGRGIELLLEAFSSFNTADNVLIFMGGGQLESLIKQKANKHKNIFFHPTVNIDVLLNYTCSADYGVCFTEDTCLNHRYCLPNKIFEYMMAGLPVLISNLFEMKRLVEMEGVGIVAKENTVESFKEAVVSSLEQNYLAIQKNVFEARKRYCWEEQQKVLEGVYREYK
tara:strand:- start:138 stop:1262 length:1125 start_codon:yes stop_codon:yes gene_type:complete